MGRGNTLTKEEIGKIDAFKQENYSNREIANKIGRSHKVINNYVNNPENYGKNRKGCTARATTERERRSILREASNSAATARVIKDKVGCSASIRTVRRVIQQCPHIKRKKFQKKPHLLPRHKTARLEYCRHHIHWKEEWHQVIFSDEKKFNLDGPDGFQYYFHDLRKSERFLSRRHTAVGSVMVWAAISFHGVVDLVVLDGRQTSSDYIELLEVQKINFQEMFNGQQWILQQDNAPIHTARRVKQWFTHNSVEFLEWPAVSPDLNIIENLWGWLSRTIYAAGTQFHNREELIAAIEDAFEKISLDDVQSLYNSLPNRLFEVVRNNGGPTRY